MNKTFQVPAILAKLETLSDGSIKTVFETPEMSPEDAAAILAFRQRQGWLLFKEQPFAEKDIPEDTIQEFPDQKSPSQRLRNTLYVLHQKRGGKQEDFEEFRQKHMEKIINWIKDKINELG